MTRTRLLTLACGVVEDVTYAASGRHPSAEDFSPEFQISFPYSGVFIWHVGSDEVVGDANQILFVTGGEAFRLSTPQRRGYAELILTPALATLSELTEARSVDLAHHPLFKARSRRATPTVQRAAARLLHNGSTGEESDLFAAEVEVLALLCAALEIDPAWTPPSAPTRRLIRRTKEFLESAFMRPLRLCDVAGAVGASPAYLTDVFRRFEGVSLQRYVTQLRLARALTELRDAHDLSALALDLGFSSHSHFTLAFRRAFGCPPSEFRLMARRRARVPAIAAGETRERRDFS